MITPLKVPIFKKKIKDHSLYKDSILHLIKNYSYSTIKGDTLDIISDYDLGPEHDRKYAELVEQRVRDCLVDFSKSNSYYSGVELRCFFYQQYGRKQYHGWHIHDCQYSGVYYLDLPKETPKTQYIDPLTGNICQLDIEEGDVIAFPSFLVHQAPPNESDILKTIISFNFNFLD